MNFLKIYPSLFLALFCFAGLSACGEFELTPRLEFSLELAPNTSIEDNEKIIILKNLNVTEASQVKIQGIWAGSTRITEFTQLNQGTQLEVHFVLPASETVQEIEVAASSPEYALNVRKISID